MIARVRASRGELTFVLLTMSCFAAGCNGHSTSANTATNTSAGTSAGTSPSTSAAGTSGSSSTPSAASPAGTQSSASATAALSWAVPSVNTDGTTLTDLAGYRIYYGTDAAALNSVVQIIGASTTAYVVSNLSHGTYYFTIKAYNTAGSESNATGIVSAMI
jgi:hypothetical protein